MLTTDAEDESPEPLPLTADEPRVSHEGALQAGIAADHDATLSCGPRSIVETLRILWVGHSVCGGLSRVGHLRVTVSASYCTVP